MLVFVIYFQRGHGSGSDVVTHTDPRTYKVAQAITLGWDYGQPRVMSSFYFGDDSERGPPADQNEKYDVIYSSYCRWKKKQLVI